MHDGGFGVHEHHGQGAYGVTRRACHHYQFVFERTRGAIATRCDKDAADAARQALEYLGWKGGISRSGNPDNVLN